MIRLILFVLFLGAIALGLAWFADRPGSVVLNWMGYEIETSFYAAFLATVFVVAAFLVSWNMLGHVISTPAAVYRFFDMRRQRRGQDALSTGLIAISAGDKTQAVKYSNLARQALPNDPMTALLRAQTAQLCGDRATARRIYASMVEAPNTELLGLRGLFLEAQRENEIEAARQFAERAMRRDPRLSWAVEALLDIQCKAADWAGALTTLSVAKAQKHFDKKSADRKRAVLLTAQALGAEESDIDKALTLALEAHNLAPALTPAAALAGRILAAKGNTSRAAKVVAKAWRLSPQPDLAVVYAFARPGDATRDRLMRVRKLAAMTPNSIEGPIAVALASIEALDFESARSALEPLLSDQPTQRVCTLMARIEAGEFGDKGRVREWLARGLNAPRDPAWTADGYISDHWQPVSPVTGRLDVFAWKVPVEAMEASALEGPLDEFLALEQLSKNVLIRGEANLPAQEPFSSQNAEESTAITSVTAQPAEHTLPATVAAKSVAEPGGAPLETFSTQDAEMPKEVSSQAPNQHEKQSENISSDTPRTVPETGNRGKSSEGEEEQARSGAKTRIFVPPRAPDDPGPEPMDPDEARTPLARYRMPASKRS